MSAGAWNPQPELAGALLRLRPLQPDDWHPLYAVASDRLIWEQHPAHDRWQEPVFRRFFDDALACGGAFVAIDQATDAIIGSSRYFGYDASAREVEIGWTFLARSYWGGRYNHEMKRLMLDHAFQWVDRVLFMIGVQNIRSQTAVQRIGSTLRARVNGDARGERLVFAIDRAEWVGREHRGSS